jgi:hypothetical protein
MILLNYFQMDLLNQMISFYPYGSKFLILSYYFIFYFIILNIIFVILLRAYQKVKQKESVSLLKPKLIYEGFKIYLKSLNDYFK